MTSPEVPSAPSLPTANVEPMIEEQEEEVETVEEEITALQETDEIEEEMVDEVEEEVLAEEDVPDEKTQHSGLLMTEDGFAVRLPPDSVNNIINSLKQTPHEGYLPVVAFSPSGQIVLNFESESNGA